MLCVSMPLLCSRTRRGGGGEEYCRALVQGALSTILGAALSIGPGCSPARLLERGARAGTLALVCGLPVPRLLLFSDNSTSYRLDKTRAIHRLAGRGGVVECGLSCVFPLRMLGEGGYACSAVLGEWGCVRIVQCMRKVPCPISLMHTASGVNFGHM